MSQGISIFGLTEMKMKSGIAQRAIRPNLAVIDPTVTHTLPVNVVSSSAFDVLSHACESYTARPFTSKPKPAHPSARPMSQGSNPWSDPYCLKALSLCGENIVRAIEVSISLSNTTKCVSHYNLLII
jgi:hydroxyacid-oxoacid transhydrogenase